MKKLALLFAAAIAAYCIYYDVQVGTLTLASPASGEQAPLPDHSGTPYVIVKVKNGDTVLSIAESMAKGPLPVSIDTVVRDFASLNPGARPESITAGKTYRFPVYHR